MGRGIALKVLVTGATGFIGNAILQQLVSDGIHSVIASTRQLHANSLTGARYVKVGDLCAETNWLEALEKVDIVVHAAARVHVMDELAQNPLQEYRSVNVAGTLRLAEQAIAAGVRRFIFVSSIKVNGEENHLGRPFTSGDTPNPKDPYGVSKLESELALHHVCSESSMELTVIRPPLVYDPCVRANFLRLINAVYKGVPLPLASINNRRSLIGLSNFVDIIIKCLDHPNVAGKTYLVCDGEDLSSPELIKRIARALNCSSKLIPFPPTMLKLSGRLLGKSREIDRLVDSLEVDSLAIKHDLQWTPLYTVQQELNATAEWYMSNYANK